MSSERRKIVVTWNGERREVDESDFRVILELEQNLFRAERRTIVITDWNGKRREVDESDFRVILELKNLTGARIFFTFTRSVKLSRAIYRANPMKIQEVLRTESPGARIAHQSHQTTSNHSTDLDTELLSAERLLLEQTITVAKT